MKKKEVVLAEMIEKMSRHGNVYYEGKYEAGGKIIMKKIKNSRGEKNWKLFLTE